MEDLQGGLNGVEVVMFQRMGLLDSTIAYYVAGDCNSGLKFLPAARGEKMNI
jgi:hypothetical protein